MRLLNWFGKVLIESRPPTGRHAIGYVPPEPEPPRMGPYFEARCEWPRCGRWSYAYGQDRFLEYTSPSGGSNVKMTDAGLWACRPHAFAVGGGWRS